MREIILWTGSVFLFALFLISLPMCTDDDENKIITKYGSVTGYVTDLQELPLSQVKVEFNGDMDISDQDGKFVLEQVPKGNQVVISFSKPGYVENFKTVEVEEDKTTLTHAALSAIDVESQVDPAQENEIQFNGAKVVLPANAIVDANGNAVSGQVTVNATYFDPTGDTYIDLFPGDFVGIQTNGTETPIESFGLIQVELSQGGQLLDLKSGEEAQVEIPVPTELMGRAPATIPLWFFDEEEGQWMEEGSATLQNGLYTGEVGHFSYWNADRAFLDVSLEVHGRTVDQNGDPLPYCAVDVWGVDYVGGDYVASGPDGYFTAKARGDSKIKVEAVHSAEFFFRSDIYEFDTDPPGSFQHIGDIVISTEIATISFEEQNSGINYSLVEVFFLDQNKGWAVGEAGTVIHTSDGARPGKDRKLIAPTFTGACILSMKIQAGLSEGLVLF